MSEADAEHKHGTASVYTEVTLEYEGQGQTYQNIRDNHIHRRWRPSSVVMATKI